LPSAGSAHEILDFMTFDLRVASSSLLKASSTEKNCPQRSGKSLTQSTHQKTHLKQHSLMRGPSAVIGTKQVDLSNLGLVKRFYTYEP
jgi:hypothetical protein